MRLPTSMKAVSLRKPGGAGELFIENVPLPQPAVGQVLLEVHGIGVNRPDVLQRLGLYPPPSDADPRLGLEVSGRVIALGEGVDPSLLGADVMALCNGGGYAEYAVVPAAQCMEVPAGVSLADAATLPETYMTVWQNLVDKARLSKGQTVLVHGGSSGIGSAAIQVCKMFGARIVVTVGTDDKADFCRSLGASHVINYKTGNWDDQLLEFYPNGVDVILDMVAGEYLDRGIRCLVPGGQLIVIALLGGRFAQIDAAKLMMKQVVLTGSTLRPRTPEFKSELAKRVSGALSQGFSGGHLKTVITKRFSLEQIVEAHRWMESGDSYGKILVEIPR